MRQTHYKTFYKTLWEAENNRKNVFSGQHPDLVQWFGPKDDLRLINQNVVSITNSANGWQMVLLFIPVSLLSYFIVCCFVFWLSVHLPVSQEHIKGVQIGTSLVSNMFLLRLGRQRSKVKLLSCKHDFSLTPWEKFNLVGVVYATDLERVSHPLHGCH